MELHRYLAILHRRRALLVVCLLAGLVAGWMITPQGTRYIAESQVYVGSRNFVVPGTDGDVVSNDRLTGVERIAFTFSAMVDSAPLARDALQLTGVPRSVEEVLAGTTAFLRPLTQLMAIQVSDEDPRVAQTLADGLADALVARAETLEPGAASEGDVPQLPAYIFARADLPTLPEPTPLIRNLILASLFGLLLGGCTVFLLEYLDLTLRSADDAEERLGLPVLGAIPRGANNLEAEFVAATSRAAP